MNENTNQISPAVIEAKQRLGIVGNTPALNEAVQRAIKVAPINLSVLISGESGSGKEFFPKIIHQYSSRKHAKYIAVNCGAIPEGTIESELFGHEKGAFTGAIAARKGYFEEADGGTLFLDEVAELPLTTQARLLRVLETGEFIKVGSSTVQHTNIRVVAATNVDMVKAVAEGKFREDLYYRLSTIQINVPPLRDRGNDIMMLARKFAADFAEKNRVPRISFGETAQRGMLAYSWPGNVRQLKNIVEQMALFEAGSEIDYSILREYLPDNVNTIGTGPGLQPAITTNSYEREREMLLNLIFRLQKEISDLREDFEKSRQTQGSQVTDTTSLATIDHRLPHPMKISHDNADHHIIDIDAVEDHSSRPRTDVDSMPDSLQDTEREAIRAALARNNGNRKATAAELKISERTLYRKIKDYDLE